MQIEPFSLKKGFSLWAEPVLESKAKRKPGQIQGEKRTAL